MPQPILLMDGDQDLLDMLEGVLQHDGYPIVTARDCKKALRVCVDQRPCLVIADLVPTAEKGREFLARLAEQLGDGGPPVAILSAGEIDADLRDGPGVVAAIGKPFDIDEIRALVTRFAEAPERTEEPGPPPEGGEDA